MTLQDEDVEGSDAVITEISESSLLTFFARPQLSFLAQHRLLYQDISFDLKLTCHPAKLSLMSTVS